MITVKDTFMEIFAELTKLKVGDTFMFQGVLWLFIGPIEEMEDDDRPFMVNLVTGGVEEAEIEEEVRLVDVEINRRR